MAYRSLGDRKSAFGTALAVVVVASSCGLGAGAAGAAGGSGGIGTSPGGGVTPSGDGVFPIRAKHSYGDGLGAGRSHQGQDLLANCGKRVFAAQPGRVQINEYHGAAGNYVVVDGAGQLADTVYMHLQSRSSLRKGQKVQAGDLIGLVGDTGRTTACHLHFEMWSNPGYYEGGTPVDPEPSLRRWDRNH